MIGIFIRIFKKISYEYSELWEKNFLEKNAKLLFAYDLISLSIILILLIIIIGLLKLKPWSRSAAIVWNISIAFILIGLKLVVYFLIIWQYGIPKDFNYFNLNTILEFVLGIILIFLAISFNSKSVKELFAH
jgi:hypothetical protein